VQDSGIVVSNIDTGVQGAPSITHLNANRQVIVGFVVQDAD